MNGPYLPDPVPEYKIIPLLAAVLPIGKVVGVARAAVAAELVYDANYKFGVAAPKAVAFVFHMNA